MLGRKRTNTSKRNDQLYEESSPQEQAAMITAFVISSEMEYAFWEMAYTHETWIQKEEMNMW